MATGSGLLIFARLNKVGEAAGELEVERLELVIAQCKYLVNKKRLNPEGLEALSNGRPLLERPRPEAIRERRVSLRFSNEFGLPARVPGGNRGWLALNVHARSRLLGFAATLLYRPAESHAAGRDRGHSDPIWIGQRD